MKESAKILAAFMGVIFGFAFIANNIHHDPEENIQVVPCTMGVYKLVYLKRDTQKVNVKIYDSKNELVREEEVDSEGGFINSYDLRGHGTDAYVFRIEDSEGQVVQRIYYDSDMNLTLCQIGNTGKYKFVMDKPSDEISIDIYNDKDQLLLNDNIKGSSTINKTYNLSRLADDEGEFTFRIKENDLLKIATL